ncbi:MAG: HD domain-containing protein [bacterium]|nr:HD domain-containing protein [bacterium]
MHYSHRIADAFALAHELHRQQRRRGSRVPYITHLMAVAALVGEYGGDEDQVIAALLHDGAEDAGGVVTLERIRQAFGDRVAQHVEGCSDTVDDPKPPWRGRKQAFIEETRQADPAVKLIIAADKLHNACSTLRDLREHGALTWNKFAGKRDGTMWYYREMAVALGEGWEHPILIELCATINALDRMG